MAAAAAAEVVVALGAAAVQDKHPKQFIEVIYASTSVKTCV
jgi:hypothetical protein